MRLLFFEAGYPKRFVPATLALALNPFTFTMTALPGNPAIQNVIPAPYFGTDAFAVTGLGLIAGAIMAVGGVMWLNKRMRRAVAAVQDYGEVDNYSESLDGGAVATLQDGPAIVLAILLIVAVILLNLLLCRLVFPAVNKSYLAEPTYGETSLNAVKGMCAIIAALIAANSLVIALNIRRFEG